MSYIQVVRRERMKTLIVYTSQTGFTRKYSRWVYEGLNKKLNSELSELLTIKEAKRKKLVILKDLMQLFTAVGQWLEK